MINKSKTTVSRVHNSQKIFQFGEQWSGTCDEPVFDVPTRAELHRRLGEIPDHVSPAEKWRPSHGRKGPGGKSRRLMGGNDSITTIS